LAANDDVVCDFAAATMLQLCFEDFGEQFFQFLRLA